MTKKQQHEVLLTLIRDFTRVGSIPKSEGRERILELVEAAELRGKMEGRERIREIVRIAISMVPDDSPPNSKS